MSKVEIVPIAELPRSAGPAMARSEPRAIRIYAQSVATAARNLERLRQEEANQALLVTLDDDETEQLVKQYYREAARQLGVSVGFSRQGTRIRNGRSEVGMLAVVLQ